MTAARKIIFLIGCLALMSASALQAAQYSRPSGVSVQGLWGTNGVGSGSLHLATDEVTSDLDVTYMNNSNKKKTKNTTNWNKPSQNTTKKQQKKTKTKTNEKEKSNNCKKKKQQHH